MSDAQSTGTSPDEGTRTRCCSIETRGRILAAAAGAAIGAAALTGPAGAEDRLVPLEARRGLDITVYQNDLGLVADRRWVALNEGGNRLAIDGVSPSVIAESLSVASPAEGLSLLEQAWEPANLTPQVLLERALGQRVLLVSRDPVTGQETSEEAVLLSLAAGPVLRVGDRIEIAPAGRIVLPGGLDLGLQNLRAKPALLMSVQSGQTGAAELELRYLTHGLSWRADYAATLAADGTSLRLEAMVTLANATEVAFEDAALRLVAGEVNTGPHPQPMPRQAMMRAEASMADAAPPAPEPAGERYVYTLPDPVSLGPGERRQIALFTPRDIPIERKLRFENIVRFQSGGGKIGPVPASLRLELTNPAGEGGQAPLPAGTVRVYESPETGPLLFVGADAIANTPAGNTDTLDLGKAFDVTATSRQTALERLSDRSYETAQEFVVRNAKGTAVEVEVAVDFPPGWKMLEESSPHAAETSGRVIWTVEVPAGGEATLTFRARIGQ
mgnify:CR=1 FL=1